MTSYFPKPPDIKYFIEIATLSQIADRFNTAVIANEVIELVSSRAEYTTKFMNSIGIAKISKLIPINLSAKLLQAEKLISLLSDIYDDFLNLKCLTPGSARWLQLAALTLRSNAEKVPTVTNP